MSIVTSEIVEDQKQAHDQRYVREKHTDHLSVAHYFSYSAQVGVNVSAVMTARVPFIELSLVEAEEQVLISSIESGDVDALDAVPTLPETDTAAVRKKRFARKLLRYIVEHRELKIIRIVFYPVWYYLKFESGFTSQQIADYLDISLTKLQIINSRFQAIHDNLAFIDADDSYLLEVE
jgi:hypothetical protein